VASAKAGEGFWQLFNLQGEAPLKVCYRAQRLNSGKWFRPASVHDGGSSDLRLDGGEREGPNCISSSFSKVFSVFTRDLCVYFFFLIGSFVTPLTINMMFPGPSGRSLFKNNN
jgi:hypothetical protein